MILEKFLKINKKCLPEEVIENCSVDELGELIFRLSVLDELLPESPIISRNAFARSYFLEKRSENYNKNQKQKNRFLNYVLGQKEGVSF